MGAVAEVLHEGLHQPFAMKFLRPELSSFPSFVTRFQREARAAARIKSAYVVRTFDIDNTADGIPFMVMELLEGNDLATELAGRTVPLPELVDWMVQVCAGAQEAHDEGIVHRDIKPANIFITKTGRRRIAKLVDFGISKVTAGPDTAPNTRAPVGTLHFMSPEQLAGAAVVDGRSDLWSIGMVLYRALAGRSPFEVGPGGLAHAIADLPAIPIAVFAPDLPSDLASVIMGALVKDPGARPKCAKDLGRALSAFGTGLAYPPSSASASESSSTDRATVRDGGPAAEPAPSVVRDEVATGVDAGDPRSTAFVRGRPPREAFDAPTLPSEETHPPPLESLTPPTPPRTPRASGAGGRAPLVHALLGGAAALSIAALVGALAARRSPEPAATSVRATTTIAEAPASASANPEPLPSAEAPAPSASVPRPISEPPRRSAGPRPLDAGGLLSSPPVPSPLTGRDADTPLPPDQGIPLHL
jgi:serine/threonine-protein kinase